MARSKQVAQQTPATTDAAPAAPVKRVGRFQVMPLSAAIAHNKALQAEEAPAPLAKPEKGSNPKRVRVYGYDNGEGGMKIDLSAKVVLVPGPTGDPKGVNGAQWSKLQSLAGSTGQSCKDNGVTARTLRRAYRAGFIRFVK
jgi:hypothetical protein